MSILKNNGCIEYQDQLLAPGEFTEAIFRDYYAKLYGFCFKLLKNSAKAEDAVSETLLRVITKYHTYRGECSFTTWLYRVAGNVCTDMRRKEKYISDLRYEDLHERADQSSSSTSLLDSNVLDELTSTLSAAQRDVFLLFYVQGLDYKEISAVLNITVIAAKVRMHHARAALRKLAIAQGIIDP